MSENLDLVRSIFTEWEHADFSSAEWAAPGIEYVRADGPEPGTVMGPDALAGAIGNLFGAFQDVRAEAEEYREVDVERVLVLDKLSGRSRTSGQWVRQENDGAHLFDIQHGKVTRLVAYWDRDRALADLGLEE